MNEYLRGLASAWREYPEYLDFLDPEAPNHAAKLLERAIYEDVWGPFLPPAGARALDLGCGVGRMTQWLLDRGLEVEAVDADAESLRRCEGHTGGRARLHLADAAALPALEPVDVVIASELLCYVEDPRAVLEGLPLKKGGRLLFSVEARWGWAMAADAAPGTLGALLGEGRVRVPGDRDVRTYDAPRVAELLAGWRLELLRPTHYVLGGPLEGVAPELDRAGLLALEAELRRHPVLGPLNRAWTGVAAR